MLSTCWKPHFALAGALAAAALCPTGALAQDNENFITRTERQVWGTITRGLGLRGGDEPVIEYRERSPLVVPPSRDLPPPQANASVTNPAWPVDPDVKRARERSTAKKKTTGGAGFRDADTLGNPVSPTELNAPGRAPSSTGANTFDPRDGRPMSNSELGFTGGLFSLRAFGFGQPAEEVGTFTNEPPRDALTAPPPGYQTPSGAAPYGVTRRQDAKPSTYDPAVGNAGR